MQGRIGTAGRGTWWGVTCLLFLALALRAVILFTGQRYLRSDEAVVGLMAKHIVTRGERPLFLYGQPYGGGHAMVAYLAAPLFAAFGRSAIILTGISATISLANVALVWLILRRYFGREVALAGAGLYAFSPPVVYQAFLVNGGTETFFLALAGLYVFLRAYVDGRTERRTGLAAGLLSGLAWYAMDYALVYPATFVLLWVLGRRGRRTWLGWYLSGFAMGCVPLAVYDLTHDFAHLRFMLAPAPGVRMGFVEHFARALWGVFAGNLAAFFEGDIDNFKPAGPGGWLHGGVLVLSAISVVYAHRGWLGRAGWRALRERAMPVPLVPVVFMLVYLVMYASAKFSLAGVYTPPRYLLPLCPFASVTIAAAWAGARPGWPRRLGVVVVALLVARGAVVSLQVGMRPWHEEHGIRTSGRDIVKLAEFLLSRGVRIAFAPYEIQWRLMFETDEAVVVTSRGISPLRRYEFYDREVRRRAAEGERFAFLFRRDFAFAEWAARGRMGGITRERWDRAIRLAGLSGTGTPAGEEFLVFYPLGVDFLPHLYGALLETRAGRGD